MARREGCFLPPCQSRNDRRDNRLLITHNHGISVRADGAAIIEARRFYDQIASDSLSLADQWQDGLLAGFDSLCRIPFRCPLAPEGEKFGDEVRHLTFGKRQSAYRILFVVRGDVAIILAS